MLVPSMYDLAEVMTQSGYTEEEVFDCGISGQIAFVVVVPEIGACRVPPVALSHFMAGADEYTADGMPEHWSNQPSGPWTIKRGRLRILADSWERHTDQCHTLAEALHRQQADDEAATLRAPPTSTRTPGFYTLEEAARAIAAQEGFNAFQENELRKDLLEGDRDGTLTVRDGGGHRKFAPIRPKIPRDFVELVTPNDVNNWAVLNELQWRWRTEPQTVPAMTPEPTAAPVAAYGPAKPHSNKSEKTLKFEAKVMELMDKFWNDRTRGTEPKKGDLHQLVFNEILRGDIRGERKTTLSMVKDAAKPWKYPLVLPVMVPDSKFNDKRHPFKGNR